VSYHKKNIQPRSNLRSTEITHYEEDAFIRYTSEGTTKAVSSLDFDLQKMWDNELTKNILIELFTKTLPINELDTNIQNLMMNYYNKKYEKYGDQSQTYMENEWISMYNPYRSLNSLRKGLSKLMGRDLVESPTKDGYIENVYYCLTRHKGLQFVIDQLTEIFIESPLFLKILNMQKESIHITFLAMKWTEMYMKNITDQIIFFFAEGIKSQDFISTYKSYLIQVEGENSSKFNEIGFQKLIEDEITQKITKLVKIGHLSSDNQGNLTLTKEGSNIVMTVQRNIVDIFSNLQLYKLITLSADQLFVNITNTGKVIANNIIKEEHKDLSILAKPPLLINDVDYHEDELLIPPIDLIVKEENKFNNNNKRLMIYTKIQSEYFLTDRIKKIIISPLILSALIVLGSSLILGGSWNLYIGEEPALLMIIIGSIFIIFLAIIMNLKMKWEQPSYVSRKMDERRKIFSKN